MKEITSIYNPTIKQIYSLQTKKGRSQLHQCIAQGFRTCQTMHQYGYNLIQLYATDHAIEQATQIDSQKITRISQQVLEKISGVKNPSGIVGIFQIPEKKPYIHISEGLVLAHITDPGNMGALIRSAAAFKQNTIICIHGTDPWSPKVIQASAGTIAAVTIFQMTWTQLISYKKDLKLAALVVKHGTDIRTYRTDARLLVIGNEAHGIPNEWLHDCDAQLTISMPGNTESLNAAVAGSIALYQLYYNQI